MATKTAKKKTTTAKKAEKKKKKTAKGKGIIYEKYPEEHQATGKYKFFYALFATTTLVFAILAVILLITSIDLFNKYDSVQACARSHTSCTLRYYDENGVEIKGNDDPTPVEE